MDVQHLELALRYAKTASDPVALTVLKDAVERFLGAQKRASSPKQQPSNQNTQKWPEVLDQLTRRTIQRSGCPACGCPDGVPHFCTGRPTHPSTGIEYWMNQPTSVMINRLVGSGDDLTSRGMGNGQHTGNQIIRGSSR
ncbi:UNVERIFIED_CONTAM: hypothetical protein RF648_21810 [Kocuria sp. CPCC 205274]